MDELWLDARWHSIVFHLPFVPAQAGTQARLTAGDELLLASAKNGTLYIGSTDDLVRRAWEHREGAVPGFTRKYGVKHLVWFEEHQTQENALLRERQMKKWNRAWKCRLIERANPAWRDLAIDIGFG